MKKKREKERRGEKKKKKKKERKGEMRKKEREGLKSGEENEIEAGEREEQKERQLYDIGAIPLAYPSEEEGGIYLFFKLFLPAFAQEGGGESAPCEAG